MNSQNRSNQSSYETLKQQTHYMACPGSCTCNLGGRSKFDQTQYSKYVRDQNPFHFHPADRAPGLFPQKYQENFQNNSDTVSLLYQKYRK